MRCFNHENIVKLHRVLKPLDSYNYNDLYIVFEALQTDLAQIIRSPQPITTRHIQFFTFQLLNAMAYLHSCNVVHRDLKPRNLLVNGNCTLKVADFGLSRIYNESNQTKMLAMTEYVTTRWYRAPEILVGFPIYGKQVDIWAIGCILGELILRFPIFPGKDSKHQFSLIVERLGKPKKSFCSQARKAYFKKLLDSMIEREIEDMDIQFSGATKPGVELLKKCLEFDPAYRITAEEALQENYFKFSRSMGFKVEQLDIDLREFLFEEDQQNSTEKLREEISKEIDHYDTPIKESLPLHDKQEDKESAIEENFSKPRKEHTETAQAIGKSHRSKTFNFNERGTSKKYLFECLSSGAANSNLESSETPFDDKRSSASSVQCTIS